MTIIFELLPLILFFATFKWYGIYVATYIGIVMTAIIVLLNRVFFANWDKKQVITLFIFLIFGSMTLYFHNPIFVKWKPTILFWLFASIILISQFMQKPLIKQMMAGVLEDKNTLSETNWQTINVSWAVFFIVLGGINLYIAYHYNNAAWVNFKVFGITAALLLFSLGQAGYILYHAKEIKHEPKP